MKNKLAKFIVGVIVGLATICSAPVAVAQGTAFTYQGKLSDAGSPANTNYDFQFKLFDTATVGTGTQFGATVPVSNVPVTNGVFTVPLDFGACATCFSGANRFLEITVKQTSGSTFTTLGPRQQITSTPYAIKSQNAAAADGLSVACVSCVTSSQVASVSGSAVTGTIPVVSVPAGSASYIQNQNAAMQVLSNFDISGTGKANVFNAATQYNIGGNRALSADNRNNTIAGIDAGTNNTAGTGSGNSFFGVSAGTNNSMGSGNSVFGYLAGLNNDASANSFFGDRAGIGNTMGGNNSFFGQSSGSSTTTGNGNSFFGQFAGANNSTGSKNTFVGNGANFNVSNPTGSSNTLLGADTGVASGVSNGTAIGANAQVTQSNSLVLGNNAKVGIGTPAPLAKLDVRGDVFVGLTGLPNGVNSGSNSLFVSNDSGDLFNSFRIDGFVDDLAIIARSGIGSAAGTSISFRTAAAGGMETDRVRIDAIGNVGIGTTGPGAPLHVQRDGNAGNNWQTAQVRIGGATDTNMQLNLGYDTTNNLGVIQAGQATVAFKDLLLDPFGGNVGIGTTMPADRLHVAGDIRIGTGSTGCVKDADGTVIAGGCSSDARFKRDITPFPKLLDQLVRLQPVHFYWRTTEYPDKAFGESRSFGLVAQDVEQVLPELVTEDAKGFKVVRYNKLPLLMLQGIKELKTDNDSLKRENDALKQRVAEQEARLRRLEEKLGQ